jgi:hypothetical protein
MTSKGVRMVMYDVGGVVAQTLQQIDDVQSGRGYCQDTNIEAQIERLHKFVTHGGRDHGASRPFSLPQLPDRAT